MDMDRDDRILYNTRAANQAPPDESSPPQETYLIKRRGSRVPIRKRAPVQLHLSAANLLNISLSGALVEHTRRLRVGDVYRLSFPVRGLQVEVLARATRSRVSSVIPREGGEGQIVFQTGLEYVALEDDLRELLSAHLDLLRQEDAEVVKS